MKGRVATRRAVWSAAVQAVVILMGGLACSRTPQQELPKGVRSMETSLAAAIESLNVNDTKKVDALVEDIRARSLDQSRQIVRLINTKDLDEDTLAKARFVILQLGDVAFAPILDSLDTGSPDGLVWELQTVMGFHRQNQARLVKRLESLIGDKRPLTPKERGPFTEEKVPDRRVCDEAYLMMRRLLAMEDEEASAVNARIFLYSMTEPERDREIVRLLKSRNWVSLSEQADALPQERK